MKKLFFFAVIATFAIGSINAQGQFRAGISGGIPIGDAGDLATFAIAIDLGYILEISDDFDAGVTTGYSHSFGDESTIGGFSVSFDDVQFLPLAASGRFRASDQFTIGGDIGYAFELGGNGNSSGGFYYSPRAQYSVSEAIDIVAAYRGVSLDGGSWDIVSMGIEFGID
ncbi:hypothetical protein N1F78_14225 [Seonamhaeicola sp. MEBiC1930]|uniref:outer membrane beta-barrel protein n=1 Tax=Seonamhaeicola sp. MEBiC01930 TaxID=2976768 RepID=UPI003249A3D1